jgi:hypothetical protein
MFAGKVWHPAPTFLTTEDGSVLTTEDGIPLAGDNVTTGVATVQQVNQGDVNQW